MSELPSEDSMRFASGKEKKRVRQMKKDVKQAKLAEDASWQETDKRTLQKEQRKAAKESKKHEVQSKKAADRELLKVDNDAIDLGIAYFKEWWNHLLPVDQEEKEEVIPNKIRRRITKPMPLEKNENRRRGIEAEYNLSGFKLKRIVRYSKS